MVFEGRSANHVEYSIPGEVLRSPNVPGIIKKPSRAMGTVIIPSMINSPTSAFAG